MEQAPLVDGLALDAFAIEQDGLAVAEVDIGRGQIVQALVVALVVADIIGIRTPKSAERSARFRVTPLVVARAVQLR